MTPTINMKVFGLLDFVAGGLMGLSIVAQLFALFFSWIIRYSTVLIGLRDLVDLGGVLLGWLAIFVAIYAVGLRIAGVPIGASTSSQD